MNLRAERLTDALSRTWWVLLLRGIIAVLFGVLTWLHPAISLASLVLLFGAFAFADGLLGAWAAVQCRKEQETWWVLLLGGLLGLGVGLVTLFVPGVTAVALLSYMAIWAISTGVLHVATAIRLRKEIEGEWRLALAGCASIAFGVLMMVRPGAGALAVLWAIVTYAMAFGLLLVLLAFKVKSLRNRLLEQLS